LMNVERLQRALSDRGLYTARVDGLWGPLSEAAFQDLLDGFDAARPADEDAAAAPDGPSARPIAWGARVSAEFRERICWTAHALRIDPDWLMACIAFETGNTFSPSIRNFAGSGATGLIQFMPATARGLGTTVDELAALSAEEQIPYVYRYLAPYRGRLHSLGDVYMAILWPRGIGKADDWVLWCRDVREVTYLQNHGLDADGDGKITRSEATAKVYDSLIVGRRDYMA